MNDCHEIPLTGDMSILIARYNDGDISLRLCDDTTGRTIHASLTATQFQDVKTAVEDLKSRLKR